MLGRVCKCYKLISLTLQNKFLEARIEIPKCPGSLKSKFSMGFQCPHLQTPYLGNSAAAWILYLRGFFTSTAKSNCYQYFTSLMVFLCFSTSCQLISYRQFSHLSVPVKQFDVFIFFPVFSIPLMCFLPIVEK